MLSQPRSILRRLLRRTRLCNGGRALRGFSLIELLLVFTIIMVLTALLVPALKSARDAALQTACMGNLRQIGLAMNVYGMDRRYYPLAYENNKNWTHHLERYISSQYNLTDADDNKRSKIFQCPARTYKPTNIVNTYGVHDRVFGDALMDLLTNTQYPREHPFQERPAEVMMMADSDQRQNDNGGESMPQIWYPLDFFMNYAPSTANSAPLWGVGNNKDDNSILTAGQIRFRHRFNRRANFMFIDGHIESLDMNQVKRRHIRISG